MQREGKHAAQARKQVEFPFSIAVKVHFRIAGRLKYMPDVFKLLFEGLEIIDFPIEDDVKLPIPGVHGLMPRWGQVYDAESPVCKTCLASGVDPITGIVGATVSLCISKAKKRFELDRSPFFQREDARDSAHSLRLARSGFGCTHALSWAAGKAWLAWQRSDSDRVSVLNSLLEGVFREIQ